ncbi:MAG TPA: hypothetical protein VGI42_05575 [Chthoniobacterales bacterium]
MKMNKQLHSERQAIQYLLGSLSVAEMEKLDALSFTDSQFAGELTAAEHDLVDAYVHGELTDDTLKQFESHYLASPLRREKVEFARTFQLYANANAPQASEYFAAAQSDTRRPAAGLFSLLSIFQNQSPAWRWSFAFAAIVLLAVGGWWTFSNYSGRNDHVVASFVLAPPLRGSAQVPTLPIPKKSGEVAIQLELEANDYPTYLVALLEQPDNRSLWSSAKVSAKTTGTGQALNISFPAALLKGRTYVLQVRGIPANGEPEIVGDYPFKL